VALAGVLGVCGLAVWISHEAESLLGVKDPGAIVVDEIAGMAVACWGLPFSLPSAIVLFGLFRLFDIFKPFPVGWLDRRLTGGLGIVADDVAAGILANLVYRLGCWLTAAI
jgi:phosphatidylglycerophosphatase A